MTKGCPGDALTPCHETTAKPYRHNYTDGVSVTYPEQWPVNRMEQERESVRMGWMHLQGTIFHPGNGTPTFVPLYAVKSRGSLGFPNFYYARNKTVLNVDCHRGMHPLL